MATVSLVYTGELRVECTHLQSDTVIVTDAPVDNHGKGEAFSPTDLCATALAACAMTIIGMYGAAHKVDVTGMKATVNKSMSSSPRRIRCIEVVISMPDREYSDKEKRSIEHAAYSCPVHLSLHPETERIITFQWTR